MYSMGADMNFVASIKKGVRGWLKNLRDPPNLFQEPIWKVRVEFLVLTLLSPILIPRYVIEKRMGKWRRHRRMPPIFQLFEREGGFQLRELEQLIADGADVNARERKDGKTPLIFAVMQDSPWEENGRRWLEVCRVLLEAGADPDADYDCGEIRRSPIYFAYLAGNVELLDLLLQAGANPRSKAWLQFVNAEPRPDAWLEQQRPEIRDRLCRWETEQEALRLDATLPGATKAVPNSRARL